jgi:hypothetical protein
MKTFYKQPSEVVDYDINSVDYFSGISDEWTSAVISIDTVTVPPLEAGPGALSEYDLIGDPKQVVKIWLGGGLNGTRYKVTAVLTSVAGRVEEEEFYLKVKEI